MNVYAWDIRNCGKHVMHMSRGKVRKMLMLKENFYQLWDTNSKCEGCMLVCYVENIPSPVPISV